MNSQNKKIYNFFQYTPKQFYKETYKDLCFYASSCITGGLTSVATQNSATVTWSGTGTAGDPLIATVQGEITAPPSTLILASDSGGNLVDGTANVITRPLTGFVTDGNTAITATDTILVAFTKAQGQIDARISLTSPITGFTVGANSTMLAADTLLAALGKVQGQLNARITTATVLSAFTVGANTTVTNSDNIITSLGKLQGQINARALTSSLPTAANPTASLGLTAVNGAATTFMRSDAAPALDQAITPTWTGKHIFSAVATAADPTLVLQSTNPVLEINRTSNGANMKKWTIWNDGSGNLFTDTNDDTGVAAQHAIQITRTAGTVTSHRFFINNSIIAAVDNTGLNVTGNINNSGAVISGQLSAAATASALASPTNSGVYIMSTPSYADINLYDASQAANARSFDIINFQNKIQFRLKNDAGSSVVLPLTFNGGFAGYTGVTANVGTGTWAFNGASSYASPVVVVDVPDKPMIVFHASGGLANRKRWFISGENGNFLQHGITDDAGGNPIIGYSMFRGVNVVGGHNWFIGDGTITNPVAQIASTGVTINMSGLTAATASAAFEIQSTTQGFLPPKMTTTERDAIASPVAGLIVYNTTLNKLNLYNGTAWELVTSV